MGAAIDFNVNFWTVGFLSLNFLLVLSSFFVARHKAALDDLHAVKRGLEEKITAVTADAKGHGEAIHSIHAEMKYKLSHVDLGEVHEKVNVVVKQANADLGDVHEKVNAIAKQTERLLAGNELMLEIYERRLQSIEDYLRKE